VCTLYPDRFIGVCALPQSPGVEPKACEELECCVNEFGFVGCNLNPEPLTGRSFDDNQPCLDAIGWLTAEDRRKILGKNAARAYPRLAPLLERRRLRVDSAQ